MQLTPARIPPARIPPAAWPTESRWTPLAPPAPAAPRASVVLLTGLFVVALAGRFSLDRLGFPTYGISDPRMPGCVLLSIGAFYWYASQWARGLRPPWPPMVLIFAALIGTQLASALWSPLGARREMVAWDLAALLILVLAATVLSAGDPTRAARVLLVLILAAAIFYAVAAMVTGPGLQGRYSAFGGGPNVFVRVICMGIIAAVTLATARRGWLLFLLLPLFAGSAVLSGSRGGLVSFVAAAVAFLVLFPRRIRARHVIAVVAVVALMAGAVTMLPDGRTFLGMADSRYSISGIEQSDFSYRPTLMSYAWSLFLEHPLSGGGLDSYYATFGIIYPHNYLLALAAESGLVAVALALAAVLRFWRDGHPWSRASREQVGCAIAAIYIALASNFSGDYYDTRFFWILAVVALLRPPTEPGRESPPVPDPIVRTRS